MFDAEISLISARSVAEAQAGLRRRPCEAELAQRAFAALTSR